MFPQVENSFQLICNTTYSILHKNSELERSFCSRKSYLKERATVKLYLPRLHGNTTIAAKLLCQYFDEAILLTHDKQHHEYIMKILIENQSAISINDPELINSFYDRMFTYHNYDNINISPSYKIIIMDNSCLLSRSKINRIYEKFLDSKAFIFLG